MNLSPPAGAPSSERPFQRGRLLGRKSGVHVARDVEWLVDTGAEISTIRSALGSAFDVNPTALSASPTTGGGGIQVVTGLTVEFEVEDVLGNAHIVQATKYTGIKKTNGGSDALGMAHVAEVGAMVSWDPTAANGSLHL